MSRGPCLVIVLILTASACSAPYQCDPKRDEPASIAADPVSGEARLTADGGSASIALRATLTGLPELWESSDTLSDGRLNLRISVAYEGEPKGNDGKTEMPRVALESLIDGDRWVPLVQTPTFASGFSFGELLLFEPCSAGQSNCCAYGETTCTQRVQLLLRRRDAQPFPPVMVSWRATPQVSVACLAEGDAQAELTLEQEEP